MEAVKNREDCRAKYAKSHNPPCAEWELWRQMRAIARELGGPNANLQSSLSSGPGYVLRLGVGAALWGAGRYDDIRPEQRRTSPKISQN